MWFQVPRWHQNKCFFYSPTHAIMAREESKPAICAICNEVQRCSHSPPPSSNLCLKRKKKSDPTYLRQCRSPYAELSISSPVKGTNLTKKMSNTSCLPWCVGRWEMTAAWTRGFVRLTQRATVSEKNATVTSFHQSSSLCSLLLHFQSRQLQRQRKRMIIMGTITKLV